MDINRICVLGNVDASKSTLIGVLKTGLLDNGKGSARSSILQLKHEKESGNTTNSNLIKIWVGNKYIQLVDLPGHTRYFSMVLRGIMEYRPSYAIIMISSLKGISDETDYGKNKGKIIYNMAKMHINVCLFLQLPMIIVISKVDNCPEDQLKKTQSDIKEYLKKMRCKFFYSVCDDDTMNKAINAFSVGTGSNLFVPVFNISNVTGFGLNLLKDFLFKLSPRDNMIKDKENTIKFAKEKNIKNIFEIYKSYYVKGIGLIVFGYNKLGIINKNDKFNIGPIGKRYIEVRVKSIHDDDRNESSSLKEGDYGCLAIVPINGKDKINKKMINKGKVITDTDIFVMGIKTKCIIAHHQTTINKRYNAFLHAGNVGETATVFEASKFPIRGGDHVDITFKFKTGQFIYPGSYIIFREDYVKGYGIILENIYQEDFFIINHVSNAPNTLNISNK